METSKKNSDTIIADTPARFEIQALRAAAARHAFLRRQNTLSLKEFVCENLEAVRAYDKGTIFRVLASFRQVEKDLSHDEFSALCARPARPAAAAPSSSSSSSSSTEEYAGPSVVPRRRISRLGGASEVRRTKQAVVLCRAITDMLATGAITARQARETRALICRDERTRLVVALYDHHLSGEDDTAMTAINEISPPEGK
ncbi:hypothetical protein HKX48_001881 [Thoreauomyces humboldtii]|nr:hypothetical protein HKX48_001881 [Thoreauomyces humboldtii]